MGISSKTLSIPHPSSGYNGRLSWDPLTVLIAIRGSEAAHMQSVTDVTIAVDADRKEDQTTVDYETGMKRVSYGDDGDGARTAIANDVDEMLCIAPKF